MHKLEDLKIWNKAMNVAEKTYLLSANFPSEEKFGLTSQIRRSAMPLMEEVIEVQKLNYALIKSLER